MADYECSYCHHLHTERRRPPEQCEGCGSLTCAWLAPTCCQWWSAPRADVPRSVDVNHVCAEPLHHEGECVCSCGARA
jgi:hypothetical protein